MQQIEMSFSVNGPLVQPHDHDMMFKTLLLDVQKTKINTHFLPLTMQVQV